MTSAHKVTTWRCADAIVDALQQGGVDTIYGVPGGAISPIYDALISAPRMRVISARHETAAVFMAMGHARMRPESLPCVLVTSGPGLTNAVTGLASVAAEGTPLVMLGGEVPRSKFGRNALQEGSPDSIDVVSMVRRITRYAEGVTIPSRAVYQLAAAIRHARTGRGGPVFLSFPLDVAVSSVPPGVSPSLRAVRPILDPVALDEAASAIRRAANPLVIVGSGARRAAESVRAFVDRLRLPVISSPKAKGIVSETAPNCLGVFGYGGHPSAQAWLTANRPDVVLALGCGFTEPSTNSWSPLLQGSECMIAVDVDPEQFGRNYRIDVPILADCRDVLPELDARIPHITRAAVSFAGVQHLEPEVMMDDRTPLRHARVLRVIQDEVSPDAVFTADIGEHLLFAVHYLTARWPAQFITSLNLGSMGSGIGAAIGAKVAAPERPVVCICGDFGFQMYGMDLNTCVQEGIGVIFVIMNDARMRMVEAGLQRNYGRHMPMDGPRVDFAALARAHGARGFVAETVEELRTALRSTHSDVPTVIDVRVDPNSTFPVNGRVQEISNFVAK